MQLALVTLICCCALAAAEFPVGSTIDAITLSDAGKSVNIKPSAAKATAIVFVSTNCPVSNAYNERFNELYRDYNGKGVQFVFVNSNANEAPPEIDAHAKKNGFGFKVYKDQGNAFADKLNAQYTPEVFLFDKSGKLAYHGRIDDSRDLAKITKKDTRTALDALLAGSAVPVTETKAFGCTIKRAKGTS